MLPPHSLTLPPPLPSRTPFLSEQFHSCINHIQTIRLDLVPVLPSTSWFMARNTPYLSLPLCCVHVFGCLYAHYCICLGHRTLNVSRGNNAIIYTITINHSCTVSLPFSGAEFILSWECSQNIVLPSLCLTVFIIKNYRLKYLTLWVLGGRFWKRL